MLYYFGYMQFSKNLRKLRTESGMSQSLLAKRIGTTQKVITDYEIERSEPPIERLALLAKIFGVTVDELIGAKNVELPESSMTGQHGNTRTVQLVKLFEKLSTEEQRTTLKQIRALVEVKNRRS